MISSPASRRSFLKHTGIFALLAAAPNLLLARKAVSKSVVVGAGKFRYECDHEWAKLPSGHQYGGASHGTAIDSQGMIYITHHGSPGSIFVFDEKGKLVRSLGEKFMIKGRAYGHGIDIRKEGSEEFMYLSPNDSTGMGFAKMSLKGELVWQKDRKVIAKDSGLYEGKKARFRATNVNFLPNGGYCLGDGYGSGYMHLYDKNDKYVSSFGGGGTANGKFKTPHGQWLDQRDGKAKIVVCDRANARLQWFSLDGSHIRTQDGLLFPADIDIQGDLMLVPDLHARITIFDKNNKAVAQLGDVEGWREKVLGTRGFRNKPDQWRPGRFIHPHDACFDKDGNIFVAEWVAGGRVTKLRKLS
ncbi:MAG: peptidase [Verrucomicrobiales bacterium]|nr:peptidase [Verrucomicrobiales bacterium]